MCSPILAGGLAGYGADQLSNKDRKTSTVTNNYYGNQEQEVQMNRDLLKTDNSNTKTTNNPAGPSQSSRTDRAY
jgi:hypothetical protein